MMNKILLRLATIAGLSSFALFAAPTAALAQRYTSPAPAPSEFGPAPDAGLTELAEESGYSAIAEIGFSSYVTRDGNLHVLRHFYYGRRDNLFGFTLQINCGEMDYRYTKIEQLKNG